MVSHIFLHQVSSHNNFPVNGKIGDTVVPQGLRVVGLIQGVILLSPCDSWDGLQHNPECWSKWLQKMDGWMEWQNTEMVSYCWLHIAILSLLAKELA